MPVDDTVVDTPGELGPKGYLDRRTGDRTDEIEAPVGGVSAIMVHFRRFMRGSLAISVRTRTFASIGSLLPVRVVSFTSAAF